MITREEDIFYIVMLDFLRELPESFDRNTATIADCNMIIKNFMVKHGLWETDINE